MNEEACKTIIDRFEKDRLEFGKLIKCINCQINDLDNEYISSKILFKLYLNYKKCTNIITTELIEKRIFFMNILQTFAVCLVTIIVSLFACFVSYNYGSTIKLNLKDYAVSVVLPFSALALILFVIFYNLIFVNIKKEIEKLKMNYEEQQIIDFLNKVDIEKEI